MSGMLDTVIVIGVPGGPDIGDIVTFGLPRVLRSEVAQTELRRGKMINPMAPIKTDLLNSCKIAIYN